MILKDGLVVATRGESYFYMVTPSGLESTEIRSKGSADVVLEDTGYININGVTYTMRDCKLFKEV